MATSKILLKTEGSGRVEKKAPQHRKVLIGLCCSIVVMIALVTYYYQQPPTVTAVQLTQLKTPQSTLDKACRDKLIGYIEQGGVDIESKMQYGDLRNCNFGSASEQARQLRASKTEQRSWKSHGATQ
ncbi:MAG: hypothetical protein V7707_04600 [Motiliproteus sp.]